MANIIVPNFESEEFDRIIEILSKYLNQSDVRESVITIAFQKYRNVKNLIEMSGDALVFTSRLVSWSLDYGEVETNVLAIDRVFAGVSLRLNNKEKTELETIMHNGRKRATERGVVDNQQTAPQPVVSRPGEFSLENWEGEQQEKLNDAFTKAFPTKQSLEQMLKFGLDKRLHEIVLEDSLKNMFFKLVEAADAEGWLENLIAAAIKQNPHFKTLLEQRNINPAFAKLPAQDSRADNPPRVKDE